MSSELDLCVGVDSLVFCLFFFYFWYWDWVFEHVGGRTPLQPLNKEMCIWYT